MPKSPPPYPPELRRRLVEMVRAGRSPAELAKEFEQSEQAHQPLGASRDRSPGLRTRRGARVRRTTSFPPDPLAAGCSP
jgi:transposase